jgi:hypothetical protein
MRSPRVAALVLVSFLVTTACSDRSENDPGGPSGMGSFALLQTRVLTPQCATCHRAGTPEASESGLILESAVAYDNLVNAAPKNANARADGMLRVTPFDANKSLLFHKLQWDASHHSRDYGNPMPLGTQSLFIGQIEYVRQWIAAGAPRAGNVADSTLLNDRTTPFSTFTPLATPAQGYQLTIEPFNIQPNFERELFVYKPVGNNAPVFVNRIETKMRNNSHHLLIQTFATNTPAIAIPTVGAVRDIRNADGSMNLLNMAPMAFHVFFAGAMTPSMDYRFPTGVAIRLPANAHLDLNTHYVNRSSASIPGEAYINLHTVNAAEVTNQARVLEFYNNDFALPARTRTVITKSFPVTQMMRVFMLTSHMHEHGEKFVIRISGGPRDGEAVYTNEDWAHPQILNLTKPLVLQPGQSLISEVTYNNTTDRTISFGLTSQDEMDIIFGYWY